VHGRDDPGVLVGEEHRDAVGDEDGEGDARLGRDRAVAPVRAVDTDAGLAPTTATRPPWTWRM
jgi:hypothetical protein